MLVDRITKSSSVTAIAILLATFALASCSSDSGTGGAGAGAPGDASASPTPVDTAGGTSFDITITGSEDVAVQGTEMQCMAGSWTITGDTEPALGTAFEVGGVPAPNGDYKAEAMSVKWVSTKSPYLSISSKGFTLSDDDLTVTMENVELQGEKGTAKVSGTMVCGG